MHSPTHLFKEAMLFVRNSGARLGKLASLLPKPGPHVLLLQQGVKLGQRVKDLLGEYENHILKEYRGQTHPYSEAAQ